MEDVPLLYPFFIQNVTIKVLGFIEDMGTTTKEEIEQRTQYQKLTLQRLIK